MKHQRKISVIGLGYVGLPVAVAFGNNDTVVGFDISEERISALQQNIDKTNEISSDELAQADILFTTDPTKLKQADFHIVTVPTPITDAKHPDMSALIKASELIGSQLKLNDIIVYESTVYPGATEEECLPILEKVSGLISGKDFHIGYSPERINPGDKSHPFAKIQKVVSAQNLNILDIIADTYASVLEVNVHRVSSIKVAEAAKVIENTQRDVNIALMNQLALLFDKLDIDTGDVLEAASTKWNFLPFTPGLVGGHCIGIDPYYLTHKATISGYIPDLILAARNINEGISNHITDKILKSLLKKSKDIKQSIITILGVTFKEDVPDIRNSRVLDIVNELKNYGITIQIHDPHADVEEVEYIFGVKPLLIDSLKPADAVILAVSHKNYKEAGWKLITDLLINESGIVFDVKGILNREKIPINTTLLRL